MIFCKISRTVLSFVPAQRKEGFHPGRSVFYINVMVSEQSIFDQGVCLRQVLCLGTVEFAEFSSQASYVVDQKGKLWHAYVGDHYSYCVFHPNNCESMERWNSDTNNYNTECIVIGSP